MQTTTATQPRDLLSLLRLVEPTPEGDAVWARHCTTRQAAILRLQLPSGAASDLTSLSTTIGIPIEVVHEMPIPGTAFPAHDKWHIHISDSLNPAAQLRTALHELKHIIDHPMRRTDGGTGFSVADYELQANLFAGLVLGEADS